MLLALAGALAIAFSGILVRLADLEPSTAAFFRCAYAVPFLIPLAVWERRTFGPREPGQARLAWIAGLVFAADLSSGTTRSPLIAAVPVVLAGVAPSPASSARTPTATSRRSESYSGSAPRSRIRASCSCCGPATATSAGLLGRSSTRRSPRPSVPPWRGWRELELVPSWPEHNWLLLLAVSAQVIGWLLITASLPRLPAAVSSVLLTAQPAATVLLAMLLVDEDPSFVQLAGVLVVIAGVATVAGRRRPAERGIPT